MTGWTIHSSPSTAGRRPEPLGTVGVYQDKSSKTGTTVQVRYNAAACDLMDLAVNDRIQFVLAWNADQHLIGLRAATERDKPTARRHVRRLPGGGLLINLVTFCRDNRIDPTRLCGSWPVSLDAASGFWVLDVSPAMRAVDVRNRLRAVRGGVAS